MVLAWLLSRTCWCSICYCWTLLTSSSVSIAVCNILIMAVSHPEFKMWWYLISYILNHLNSFIAIFISKSANINDHLNYCQDKLQLAGCWHANCSLHINDSNEYLKTCCNSTDCHNIHAYNKWLLNKYVGFLKIFRDIIMY